VASTTSDPKARGAYYTPTEVAQFLASWAVRSPSASVLEPSAGDGVFIRAAYEVFARLGQVSGHVVGIEIDGPTVDALLEMAPDTATIIQSDFFAVDGGGFDAVIGNPPFVRYQHFTGANRDLALRRAAEAGVALPELSSSWAPFVVYAAHMLTPSGRLAMVVPLRSPTRVTVKRSLRTLSPRSTR
jgi:adenine-specific DNA-methyltransferase